MDKRKSIRKDRNQLAKSIVDLVTSDGAEKKEKIRENNKSPRKTLKK